MTTYGEVEFGKVLNTNSITNQQDDQQGGNQATIYDSMNAPKKVDKYDKSGNQVTKSVDGCFKANRLGSQVTRPYDVKDWGTDKCGMTDEELATYKEHGNVVVPIYDKNKKTKHPAIITSTDEISKGNESLPVMNATGDKKSGKTFIEYGKPVGECRIFRLEDDDNGTYEGPNGGKVSFPDALNEI